MKKTLFAILLSAVATVSSFAQSQINFDNRTSTLGYAAPVLNTDGSPLVGQNFVAQLYLAADPTTAAVTEAPSLFRVPTTSLPGTWSGGTRTLIGSITAGQTVNLIVRVWDNNFGSYAGAVSGGGAYGESASFSYTAPSVGAPPSSLIMAGFQGFQLQAVPEPSTFALGALGIGALLLVRRRKA